LIESSSLRRAIWAFGENPVAQRVYIEKQQTIRVDTLRKVVIIAIGGKVGNPLLTCMFLQLSEQERIEELHPLSLRFGRRQLRWDDGVAQEEKEANQG
jgi:hypothetical protein